MLQEARISAGAVVAGPGQWEDPNLQHRGFFREVVHPLGGSQLQRSFPFRLSPHGGTVYRPAPLLGEHTNEVLGTVLGFTNDEIGQLDALGVTATDTRQTTRLPRREAERGADLAGHRRMSVEREAADCHIPLVGGRFADCDRRDGVPGAKLSGYRSDQS